MQLAISKEGIIAGSFQNTETDKALEIEGVVSLGLLAVVLEGVLAEPVEGDAAQVAGRDDAVGVDVGTGPDLGEHEGQLVFSSELRAFPAGTTGVTYGVPLALTVATWANGPRRFEPTTPSRSMTGRSRGIVLAAQHPFWAVCRAVKTKCSASGSGLE